LGGKSHSFSKKMDYQHRLNKTIQKLRLAYNHYRIHRPTTVLLTNQEYFELYNKQTLNLDRNLDKSVQRTSVLTNPIRRCQARKANGDICDAKIKTDLDFCNRHVKMYLKE
jgi:hypothetical protein